MIWPFGDPPTRAARAVLGANNATLNPSRQASKKVDAHNFALLVIGSLHDSSETLSVTALAYNTAMSADLSYDGNVSDVAIPIGVSV